MSQLLPSEGVNSDEISMGTSNSSEMNLENNDEADHQQPNKLWCKCKNIVSRTMSFYYVSSKLSCQ